MRAVKFNKQFKSMLMQFSTLKTIYVYVYNILFSIYDPKNTNKTKAEI